MLRDLFAGDASSDEDDDPAALEGLSAPVRVVVRAEGRAGEAADDAADAAAEDVDLSVRVVADDAGVSAGAQRCLFAGHIWSGSRTLAGYIAARPEIVRGKNVVEVGCGAALPGLTAAALGASYALLSDYPSPKLLRAVQTNIEENQAKRPPDTVVEARGLAWGEEVPAELRNRFQLAIASECLWNHAQHAALLQTLDALLDRETGKVLVTFAHHVKGCEADDLAFFDLARDRFGFAKRPLGVFSVPQMWSQEKTTDLFLVELSRVDPNR